MSIRGQRSGAIHREKWNADPKFQAETIRRLIIGTLKYLARRYGRPEPIFYDCDLEPMRGGGYKIKEGSLRQLSPEETK
jgi:hypothetical protein